ncbi:hypothetical protein OIE62_07285 [Streptomyces scopuliridis]|uniref:Uncharacterized protein n=1 Tax=Streptomyces scopuliridis TaxID=452529 RepID=A0ACD4ZTK2_9ACTN|nr:hypothetical protein [Streptomyces scopuliridis]WSC01623.1 hypothetical protein OG835_34535 [Streptomyces scopuliridis]WSC04838.1 hypothetical protein OIE62_07285 [Streptomyces scopuliridis]
MDPLPGTAEIEAGKGRCGGACAFFWRCGSQHAEEVPPRLLHRDQVLGVQRRTQLQQARDRLPAPPPTIGQRCRAGPEQDS